MSTKDTLIAKITARPPPRNFTIRDLDALMTKCHCEKYQGGRGSGIGYRHLSSGKSLQFDAPHPVKELSRFHIRKVIEFLGLVGEI